MLNKVSSLKQQVKKLAKRKRKEKNVYLIIDGPNILRKDLPVSLSTIKSVLSEIGNLKVGTVILNKNAPEKLIEAVTNHGFQAVISPGDTTVTFSITAMEFISNLKTDILALATRNANFLPLILKAKEKGLETIVIGADPGFSVALQNAADYVINLGSFDELETSQKEEEKNH